MDDHDDYCIAGGVDIPERMINRDVIGFTNYPTDQRSRHILHLIGIHLKRFDDDQKDKIIQTLDEILGIKPFKKSVIETGA